jgi:hypothetical protein
MYFFPETSYIYWICTDLPVPGYLEEMWLIVQLTCFHILKECAFI